MARKYTALTFTDSVKETQTRFGSRATAAKVEAWDIVVAFDWDCPQHITPRFTEEELAERERADEIPSMNS